MARAVALATPVALVRMLFIGASGANGCPFLIPIEANNPTISGSKASAGSCWMTELISSYKWKSLA
jgi:hypothetical protein